MVRCRASSRSSRHGFLLLRRGAEREVRLTSGEEKETLCMESVSASMALPVPSGEDGAPPVWLPVHCMG